MLRPESRVWTSASLSRSCVLVASALVAVGCRPELPNLGPSAAPTPQSSAPQPASPRRPKPSADQTTFALGLTQTPSSQQVIESFPVGRADPFAPIPAPLGLNGSVPMVLSPEEIRQMLGSFAVRGVVKVSGRQAIFVQYENQSGEVYPGEVGGKTSFFLPQGWTLTAIDTAQGRISLAKKDLKVFIQI